MRLALCLMLGVRNKNVSFQPHADIVGSSVSIRTSPGHLRLYYWLPEEVYKREGGREGGSE